MTYMRSYSPYENIEVARAIRTALIRTSLNDSQVMYREPAKYVARLADDEDADQNPFALQGEDGARRPRWSVRTV
jgi:oligopeptidase B